MRLRGRSQSDIEREVDAHVRMAIQERVERGEHPDEARRAVLREFGNVRLAVEDSRSVWSWTALELFIADLRSGCRILTRSPGVSLNAILLIALVIGGNTAIYSAANGVINNPAVGVRADGLVSPGWQTKSGEVDPSQSWPDFVELAASKSVELAAWNQDLLTIQTGDAVLSVPGELVTRNYFSVLNQTAARGRLFDPVSNPADGIVAVIGDRFWRTAMRGREDIAGVRIIVNNRPVTIIGVVAGPFQSAWAGQSVDIWIPIEHTPAITPGVSMDDRKERMIEGTTGRLRDDATIEQARLELAALASALPVVETAEPAEPARARTGLSVYKYSGTAARNLAIVRQAPAFLAIFSVVTVITLIVVCANVSNLLLARAMTRQREMAIRQSLGASRGRLIRTTLTEGLAVATMAWALGCLFAWWTSMLLPALIPPNNGGSPPLVLDFSPDWSVIAYAMALALAGTVAMSVAPALHTWRQDLVGFLKAGERNVAGGRLTASRVLVVTQLSLTVVLLSATALAYRSLTLINQTDVRFETSDLTLVTVDIRQAAERADQSAALITRMTERIAAIPGVQRVSFGTMSPSESWPDSMIKLPGKTSSAAAERTEIGPAYFATIGARVVAGREFNGSPADRDAVIITQVLAARLWPDGETAIGKTLVTGEPERIATVIGVVADGYYGGFRNGGPPLLAFHPFERVSGDGGGFPTIYVSAGQVPGLARDIRHALAEIEPRAPVLWLRAMDADLENITWVSRVLTMLLTMFAASSLVIAALGQYAAMAFAARRRTPELAIRTALGASTRQIISTVLKDGLTLTAIGLGVGLTLGILAGRLAQGLLYGTGPADVGSLIAVTLVLAFVSLTACLIPARRASRVDPLVVLRQD